MADRGGWNQSAEAWIASMGEHGDKGRRHVLDPAFRTRFENGAFRRALDVGCGEGRLCRMMKSFGVETTGIDPTEPLIACARERDPAGDYQIARAEHLPFPNASFDLVVSCLSLVDIADYRAAICEMERVLRPGGTLLSANLTAIASAGMNRGWRYDDAGAPCGFEIDEYGSEWCAQVEWAGIRVENWHRPLGAYIQAFLAANLTLVRYEELTPTPDYGDAQRMYTRIPWFDIMEWRKPDPDAR